MRLHRLEAANWLAHPHLSVDFGRMTVVCGPNAAGKSAIRDAVAYAFKAETIRLAEAARAELLTEGADKGFVELRAGTGFVRRDIASGKVKAEPLGDVGKAEAIAVVIDPSAFSRLAANDRRTLLMRVMGVDASLAAIAGVLAERGHERAASLPFRSDGVEAWITVAERKATEARAAWKAATGETYGPKKAEEWRATRPTEEGAGEPVTEASLHTARNALERAHMALVEAHQAQGAAGSRLEPEHAARLRAGVDQLEELRAELARSPATEGETHACPCCAAPLILEGDALRAVTVSPRAGQLRTLIDARENAAAELAADELHAEARDAARGRVAAAQHAYDEARQTVSSAEYLAQAVKRADQAERDAARHHKAVLEWVAIAAALAPDGIPGEMLAAAMDPLNARFRAIAEATGWRQVAIGRDMIVRADGRPYALLSVSEQWRTDATIAVALAIESGVRFVAVDGFDVLAPIARGPALTWLRRLVKEDVLDTVIVLATLKEPLKAPADVHVEWLGAT